MNSVKTLNISFEFRIIYVQHTALFVSNTLHCLCPTHCTVCVQHTALFVSNTLHCLRPTHCTVCVQHTALFMSNTLNWHGCAHRGHFRAHGGIRTHDLSRRAAVDLPIRPRGHWERHINCQYFLKFLIW